MRKSAATEEANSISGDGTSSTGSPGTERPDTFEYDPLNPAPTIGGRLCCGNELPPGPADQRPNETRRDVLVYSIPPLESDLEATGFVIVDLYAASSVKDTDFTALLTDVDPGGYARYLADGIVRARYRNSTVRAESIVPQSVYQYSTDLWTTSNIFKKGHKIRLSVSSSNFPRFDGNLNTGQMTYGATKAIKATQKVFHDAQYRSALNLPVIPR